MTYAREEALKLYYSGKTKKHIRRKFKIEQKLLDYWIKDDTRRKALNLYLLGMKETKICKELNIYIKELNGWIKNMNDIEQQKRKRFEKRIMTKPMNTTLIDSVCSDWNKETKNIAHKISIFLKNVKTKNRLEDTK